MRQGFPLAYPGMKIGLLGGSFDPAHAGHVLISKLAMQRIGLDRVWWLVSPGNPLKPRGPAPLAARMDGARALIHDPRIIVSDVEARLGTRMTADTLTALRGLYPGVRFVWLMGADNLAQLSQWDRWREIAALVPMGVIARPGWQMRALASPAARILAKAQIPEEDAALLPKTPPPAWVMITGPMSDLSSTAIRAGQAGKGGKGGRA